MFQYCEYLVEFAVRTVNVKTLPVQFYVQRSSNYSTAGLTIPWEVARLNTGNALNLETGVFTAPRNGIYHFAFSGYGSLSSSFGIYLRLNKANVAYAFASASYGQASLQSTLELKKGDQIDLFLYGGILYDDINHYSSFSGWLDEESIL